MASKSRFTNLDEFYAAVRQLIDWLGREKHPEDAQALDSLMHTAWTTSSELLGELMLALRDMKGDYSPALRTEIDACYEFTRHHRKILGLSRGR